MYHMNFLVYVSIVIVFAHIFTKYAEDNNHGLLFWAHGCDADFNCLEYYLSGPPTTKQKEFSELMMDEYLFPPPHNPDKEPIDIYAPPWRKILDWYKFQSNLMEAFKDQPPGVFVEVGAVDGEFMSQTIVLEKNLSWTGLLFEPDPRSFSLLQESKRNAWTSPLCVAYDYPSTKKFWLRSIDEDLPYYFVQLLLARSKLYEEILLGDEERGVSAWVPCVPISSILNILNFTTVDFLSISTGVTHDEDKVKDALRNKHIKIKSFLVHFPTTRLLKNPYPKIPGYIMDMERSEMLLKFYVKKEFCKLVEENNCTVVREFDVTQSCDTYKCFDHLRVKALAGDFVVQ